jgi:hypothetical protein
MANTLEQWYASIPTVTRMYLTLTFAVTVGCALEVRAFDAFRNCFSFRFDECNLLTIDSYDDDDDDDDARANE